MPKSDNNNNNNNIYIYTHIYKLTPTNIPQQLNLSLVLAFSGRQRADSLARLSVHPAQLLHPQRDARKREAVLFALRDLRVDSIVSALQTIFNYYVCIL